MGIFVFRTRRFSVVVLHRFTHLYCGVKLLGGGVGVKGGEGETKKKCLI